MNPYDKIYNEKLDELMKDVKFEHELLSKFNFDELVINALKFHTEATLQCSLDEYERVYATATPTSGKSVWHIPEMYIALIAVQSLSPKDSGYSIPNWIGFRRNFIVLSQAWEDKAAIYRAEAGQYAKGIAKRDEREIEAKSKLYQLNGKPVYAKK